MKGRDIPSRSPGPQASDTAQESRNRFSAQSVKLYLPSKPGVEYKRKQASNRNHKDGFNPNL